MWTLAELSKIETDVLRKSVIDTLLMESNVMELVPWETIGQLATGVVRIQDLPSVGFRKVNAGYTESTGHVEQKVEHIYLLGADIDTDKAIARAKNTVADARAIQQQMVLKSLAYEFNDSFINGDPEVNVDSFKGLRKRVDDVATDGFTEQKIQHNVAAVLGTDAKMQAFLDALDQLIYSIKGHQPAYLLMNKRSLLAVRSILRRQRLLDTTQDMFGRTIDTYQGARLIDIGVKADQTTEIITNTEDADGSVDGDAEANRSSIYAVKFGIGDLTWGIQEYPLEAEDLGQLESKPVYRTRVDFPCGLATVDPRSIARLYGMQLTAA